MHGEHAMPCADLEVLQQRVQGLEDWQRRQNGSLQRMAEQIDKLQWWLIGILLSSFTSLAVLMLTHITGK